MRSFAYKIENFEKSSYVPELKEGNPCYQASVYDSVMYDETPDGDLIQCDMTQILLNQEKYRRLLGDMNVNNILAQSRYCLSSPVIVRLCLNVRLSYSSWLVRSQNYRLMPNLCWQRMRQRCLRIPHLPLLNDGLI